MYWTKAQLNLWLKAFLRIITCNNPIKNKGENEISDKLSTASKETDIKLITCQKNDYCEQWWKE